MTEFALKTETQDPGLETAMEDVSQWNYGSEVEELRRLYVKAAENQWISERDLDWDREIDHESFHSMAGRGSPVISIKSSRRTSSGLLRAIPKRSSSPICRICRKIPVDGPLRR